MEAKKFSTKGIFAVIMMLFFVNTAFAVDWETSLTESECLNTRFDNEETNNVVGSNPIDNNYFIGVKTQTINVNGDQIDLPYCVYDLQALRTDYSDYGDLDFYVVRTTKERQNENLLEDLAKKSSHFKSEFNTYNRNVQMGHMNMKLFKVDEIIAQNTATANAGADGGKRILAWVLLVLGVGSLLGAMWNGWKEKSEAEKKKQNWNLLDSIMNNKWMILVGIGLLIAGIWVFAL